MCTNNIVFIQVYSIYPINCVFYAISALLNNGLETLSLYTSLDSAGTYNIYMIFIHETSVSSNDVKFGLSHLLQYSLDFEVIHFHA